MHACVLPLNIYQIEHAFLHVTNRYANYTLPICVIALQIHHSIEPTSLPVLLYSIHIKRMFRNLK